MPGHEAGGGIADIRELLREVLGELRALTTWLRHQERVMIFIDGPNLYAAKKPFGVKIDYFKLIRELAGGRRLVRPYFYTAYNPFSEEDKDQMMRFLSVLERGGFSVKAFPLRMREGRLVEKGVDVAIVTDMLVLAFRNAYDTAILVSGDTDLVEAVRAIKAMGKRVEIAMFSHVVGEELRRSADGFIPLEEILDRITLRVEERPVETDIRAPAAPPPAGGEEPNLAER